jgi:uncharacterized protein (DUF924 family)
MFSPDLVLDFWFPEGLAVDEATHRSQLLWWFRGGADAEIVARFQGVLNAAAGGKLDGWAETARGRLALILVFDQFPRSVYRGRPEVYAYDGRAVALAVEGLRNGQYDELSHVWEKLFFALPFSHSEDLALQEWNVELSGALTKAAPAHLRALYEFALSQAQGHRDVIARFGRHPHRNEVLGRTSTPDEREYLAAGRFVHQRPLPE